MTAHFPENRKHNLAIEFTRYAQFGIGDVLETPDGEEVTVEDFAFRFEIDEFVYWFEEWEGSYAEPELEDWALVSEGEREEYVDPGFESQQIPDPNGVDESS
ncbi:hypothetical protein HLRTI_002127 [Halorhabdus tiamatea SARL4B]|uniref:Uncharacterized protein n=1 Tax=Halorhabdus tiamatea SARL4B TaxID=1033806 RepID=F7PL45_9EURY|nr:hypothetical protein [Halorhabdus tiamatea]ERJ05856.1 hypothetical protein HLRTI_002127 [Halorhabdus tiamatea SARL4B]CCQ34464.1 conserved hypothetical protein [Halorhabdus tiamatea SARL4B]